METINDLLKALDNKVPASIAKRLGGLTKLNEKLALATAENEENPTEESQEKLDEIIEFITDTQDDLRDDLKDLVAKKREAEQLKSRQIAKRKAEAEAEAKKSAEAEAEAKKSAEAEAIKAIEKEELEKKALLEKEALETTPVENKDPEKKSGIGWGGLIVGGALLILSAGAINYFGKKR
jgi:cobalamin biosynthesis Mg chelatase CobN